VLEDDLAGLTSHVGSCEQCQRRLETLAAGPVRWSESVRQLGGPPAVEPESALREVMSALKEPSDFGTAPTPPVDDGPLLSLLDPASTPELLGRLGEYDVTEIIGRGGMGVVLKAFDTSLHRYVAIKVLAPQWATSATARTRFAREARAAAAVSHEHVVAIHDVDEANGLPYLVMEYVPGLSLQERLDRDGPLDLKAILRIGMQTASGLGAAHAQGLIHRDIKPANILLENGVDRVKITDFGLARTVDDASLTQSGVLAGTPHYMAPEQARGEALDHRADLFSLGSVLYALCTGRPPFQAGSTLAVVRRVSEATVLPVHEINPDIPVWLGEFIAQLHAQAPSQRFQSATEVADLLAQYLAHVQQPGTLPLPRRPRRRLAPPPTAPQRSWLIPAIGAFLLIGALLPIGALLLIGGLEIPAVRDLLQRRSIPAPAVGPAASEPNRGETLAPTLKPWANDGPGPQPNLLGQGGWLLLDRAVWSVAFSPDGKTLAIGGGRERQTGKLGLWDLTTGKARAMLDAPLGVRSVAFSPDGKLLATGEFDHTVGLRDPATGKVRATLVGHRAGVNAVAFAPDSATLATAGLDGTIVLWDVATRKPRRRLRGHSDCVYTVAFAPDGKTLITGSKDQTARIWNITTGAVQKILYGHNGSVEFVTVSPNGLTVATASWDGKVKLWSLRGAELAELPAHPAEVYSVQFAPNGLTLATACRDGEVRLWDVRSQKLLGQLPVQHNDCVYALAYSPDGRRLATGSFDQRVQVWDLTGSVPLRQSRKSRDTQPWGQAVRYQAVPSPSSVAALESILLTNEKVTYPLRPGASPGDGVNAPGRSFQP
jgi:serine/threonine protein kinase